MYAIVEPSYNDSADAAWAGNVYAGIGNTLTFGQGVNLAARARGYGGGFTANYADTGFGAYIGGEIGGTVLQSVFFGVMPKATAGKNEQSGAFYLFENWHKGTFANRTQSIAYHMGKHGNGRSASAYTQDAMAFFKANESAGKTVVLRDGTGGVRIRTKQPVVGGGTKECRWLLDVYWSPGYFLGLKNEPSRSNTSIRKPQVIAVSVFAGERRAGGLDYGPA